MSHSMTQSNTSSLLLLCGCPVPWYVHANWCDSAPLPFAFHGFPPISNRLVFSAEKFSHRSSYSISKYMEEQPSLAQRLLFDLARPTKLECEAKDTTNDQTGVETFESEIMEDGMLEDGMLEDG